MNRKYKNLPLNKNIETPSLFVLSEKFYNQPTVQVAKELLGKTLVKKIDNFWVGGHIVEAEAYRGNNDPASHAAHKKTPRNSVMFGPGGNAYVYFIYGMYFCFNVVAHSPDEPAGAVLIRSLQPVYNIEKMIEQRKKDRIKELTNGPGKLCQALSISRRDNGKDLSQSNLLILDTGGLRNFDIVTDSRIGIKKGADLQYRFYIKNNHFVSKVKKTTT